jgi:hypothetical protein
MLLLLLSILLLVEHILAFQNSLYDGVRQTFYAINQRREWSVPPTSKRIHFPYNDNNNNDNRRWILWTTRTDHEEENDSPGSTDNNNNNNNNNVPSSSDVTILSLGEILRQLQARGIAFSPTATRTELEQMLLLLSNPPSTKDNDDKHAVVDSHTDTTATSSSVLLENTIQDSSKEIISSHYNKIQDSQTSSSYPQHLSSSATLHSTPRISSSETILVQKRRQRRRQQPLSGSRDDQEEDSSSAPTTLHSQRKRPQTANDDTTNEGSCNYDRPYSRNDRKNKDYDDDDPIMKNERVIIMRQNRRRQRQQEQATSSRRRRRQVTKTVNNNWVKDDKIANPLQDDAAVPDPWWWLDNKATRVAKQKTGQWWNELMDWAYVVNEAEAGYGYVARKKARAPRRPSPPPPQSRVDTNDNLYSTTTTTRRKSDAGTTKIPNGAVESGRRRRSDRAASTRYQGTSTSKSRVEQRRQKMQAPVSESSRKDDTKPLRPIGAIVKELNDLNVSFSPTASRQDLEELLESSRESRLKEQKSPTNDLPRHFDIPMEPKTSTIRNDDVNVASSQENGNNSDAFVNNNTVTVLDVQVVAENDTSDDAIEVELLSPEEWQLRQEKIRDRQGKEALQAQIIEKQKREQNATGRASATNRQHRGRRPIPMAIESTSASSRMRVTPEHYEPRKRIPRRPVGSDARNPAAAKASRRPTTRGDDNSNNGTRRRVYSPYGSDRAGFTEDDGLEIKDEFNRFGDFLADSVDSILWGPDDDSENEVDIPSEPTSRTRPSSDDARSNARRSRRPTSNRHWKDKVEERVDYLLGIHKDGKTYQRWMNREREEAADATGTDALSYARGRASKCIKPKDRYRPYQRKSVDETPFWEQEGSFISTLFGGSGNGGNNNRGGRIPRKGDGSFMSDIYQALHTSSLSLLIRTLAVFAARLFGSLCRWASVYETIPRPLVAFVLFAAGVAVRGPFRVRIMNMAFALLALRVIGEWLDGYLSIGDDDDEMDSTADDNGALA